MEWIQLVGGASANILQKQERWTLAVIHTKYLFSATAHSFFFLFLNIFIHVCFWTLKCMKTFENEAVCVAYVL